MGLFGKLFDKKECAICGGEIGLLGNRKLEDEKEFFMSGSLLPEGFEAFQKEFIEETHLFYNEQTS